MFKFLRKDKISRLPKNPGVYAFKKGGKFLYIGKAANIRERIKNHFPSRSEGERRTNVLRTQQPGYKDYLFGGKVKKIGFIKTDSEIEALILEANLIKKYQPKYNIIWRDDKNYFFVGITKEDFPKIFITHQTKPLNTKYKILNTNFVGPFVDGKDLKQTLKVLRKVFPYRSCRILPKRPCLWYQLERCPAPCQIHPVKLFAFGEHLAWRGFNRVKKECQENAKNLLKILRGGKKQVLKALKMEMKKAALCQDFEKAAKIRDQIEALEKILENARIFSPEKTPVESKPWHLFDGWRKIEKELKRILKIRKKISRIEAYDISNIQGQLATGSMVTFVNSKADKNLYRRFKIKIAGKPDDVAMIKEVLSRRFKHLEWGLPDLILIDGGIAQLNAAINVKFKMSNAKSVSILAIAKRKNELYIEDQKNPILLKNLPREIFNLILQLRDEAHRFAISYHKKLRTKDLLK